MIDVDTSDFTYKQHAIFLTSSVKSLINTLKKSWKERFELSEEVEELKKEISRLNNNNTLLGTKNKALKRENQRLRKVIY